MAFRTVLFLWISLLTRLIQSFAADIAANCTCPENIGLRNAAYFINWGIYDRNYTPTNISVDQLTHLFYAFANVNSNGEVYLTDLFADVEKHFSGDSWNDTGNNVYGCIRQVFLLKKRNRSLKTLLSIGGWTYARNFPVPVSSVSGRKKFAESAVTLIKDLGFDGIDIDWEYPADEDQARDFVLLIKVVRSTLDAYTAKHDGDKMLLTAASPAGPQEYNMLKLAEMTPYLDFFNILAYDFAGSFSNVAAHQANLHPSIDNPPSTPFSIDAAIKEYIRAGVPPNKIVLGMPLYGHVFNQTNGMGKSFGGVGEGQLDYKLLPKAGATERMDQQAGASYSWDAAKRVIVSYDNMNTSNAKIDYIKNNKLGGGIFWELSGDRSDGRSLITNVYHGLSADRMDKSKNTLSYPESKYDNVRAIMA